MNVSISRVYGYAPRVRTDAVISRVHGKRYSRKTIGSKLGGMFSSTFPTYSLLDFHKKKKKKDRHGHRRIAQYYCATSAGIY